MPRLIPRITQPAQAIRLKTDVLAAKGDWLLIFDDESVVSMTNDQVHAAFRFAGARDEPPAPRGAALRTNPQIKRRYHAKPPSPPISHGSVVADIEGKHISMGSQSFRVLYALFRTKDGSDATGHQIAKHIEHPADRRQLATRLAESAKVGLVIKHGTFHNAEWSLTNNGRAFVKAVNDQHPDVDPSGKTLTQNSRQFNVLGAP
jgi:hypothetical protein